MEEQMPSQYYCILSEKYLEKGIQWSEILYAAYFTSPSLEVVGISVNINEWNHTCSKRTFTSEL